MMESGLNIMVETHSEHLINGVRLYGLKAGISSDRISINYFSLTESGIRVEQIALADDMSIKDWTQGFWDQEEIDLMEMRNIWKQHADRSDMGK